MKEIKICQAEGCDRQATRKGYCQKHYARLWKNGTLEVEINGTYPRKEKFCTIKDCKNKHYAKGLCQMHYRRKLRQEKIKNMEVVKMSYPKAYDPQQGYKYQILTRYNNEAYEHCDYAKDFNEKKYLLDEYKMAYGNEFSFKTIMLPKKYWNE